jgi:hypothetical protein
MRVKWECGAAGCSKGMHEGEIWEPKESCRQPGEDNYDVAVRLGICIDPRPRGECVLVAFDDRPGVLQAHVRDELT